MSKKKKVKSSHFVMFCFHQHDVECNQTYGDEELPYSFHLRRVVDNVIRFKHLLPEESRADAVMIAAGHDLLEDARVSYNQIKDLTNERVAEGIFLCSEDRGRTRKERKSDQFYKKLCTDPVATFVKLCDIAANTMHSVYESSSMLKKAQEEWPDVKKHLDAYADKYAPVFRYIDFIHELALIK